MATSSKTGSRFFGAVLHPPTRCIRPMTEIIVQGDEIGRGRERLPNAVNRWPTGNSVKFNQDGQNARTGNERFQFNKYELVKQQTFLLVL